MVPSAFVFLDTVPLTANGKVDRKALPGRRIKKDTEPEESYVAPRTPVEQLLAAIWADVLKQQKVGVQDNFFDLGGHSLLATQVVSRIRGAFQMGHSPAYLVREAHGCRISDSNHACKPRTNKRERAIWNFEPFGITRKAS